MIFHCSIASGVLPTIMALLPMRLAEKDTLSLASKAQLTTSKSFWLWNSQAINVVGEKLYIELTCLLLMLQPSATS
jgi:hypothetical protein